MGKKSAATESAAPEQRRTSMRLATRLKVEKKKAPPKTLAANPKKGSRQSKEGQAKPAENGNNKAEEPKAEAPEAK